MELNAGMLKVVRGLAWLHSAVASFSFKALNSCLGRHRGLAECNGCTFRYFRSLETRTIYLHTEIKASAIDRSFDVTP